MVGSGTKKFAILVTLKSLSWYSFMLFQYQTQQWKQNLTNLNFTWVFFRPHLKTTFSDFNQQKRKHQSRFEIYKKNAIYEE